MTKSPIHQITKSPNPLDVPYSILHLITGLDVGGAQVSLARLAERLAARGVRNTVVSMTDPGPVAARLRAARVPVETLGMRRGAIDPRALGKLKRVLARTRPDVLQTWMYHADLLGAIVRGHTGPPALVWSVRASNVDMQHYGRLSALTRRACAWLSHRPDAIVANSTAGLDFHRGFGYRARRWVVIPNGIDTGTFSPDEQDRLALRNELGIPGDARVVGQIARHDPMKGHAIFLAAASAMLSADARLFVVLTGEGVHAEAEPFRAWLQTLVPAARERVRLLGRRDDIVRIQRALDVACSTSIFGEGFPNVIAEAMSCEVPVVATDVGDASRVVGAHGFIVPSEASSVAGRCLSLLADEARRREMGRQARRHVMTHFALERTVAQHDQLYRELIGRAAGTDGP